MNNVEITIHDAPVNEVEYQEWLAECEDLATLAGFRGLLETYFVDRPAEEYPDLAIGAKEILDEVARGILSEGQPEELCAGRRVRDLIYADENEHLPD